MGGARRAPCGSLCTILTPFVPLRFSSRFARNFRVTSLWDTSSTGAFCSLDGPAMDLKKTRERVFEAASEQFTECRGVVLRDTKNPEDDDIRLPAR